MKGSLASRRAYEIDLQRQLQDALDRSLIRQAAIDAEIELVEETETALLHGRVVDGGCPAPFLTRGER